jgi:hypothetical protein
MKQLTWPAVGLIAVLGAIALALATLPKWDPAAILGILGILAGIGGGAAVAGGMSGRVDEIAAETTTQTATLNTIERRTNGELDARIAGAMEEAAETGAARALAALREKGVIG